MLRRMARIYYSEKESLAKVLSFGNVWKFAECVSGQGHLMRALWVDVPVDVAFYNKYSRMCQL